jgi:competence protein ComEC
VQLEGKVCWKSRLSTGYGGESWQLTIKAAVAEVEGRRIALPGSYLCTVNTAGDEAAIGQTVVLTGTFRLGNQASNPGQFDQRTWDLSRGIRGRLTGCSILKTGGKASFRETLWQIRSLGEQLLIDELGEQQGSLLSAMLLGDKQGLDSETKALYQDSGLSHLYSVSGLHLMLLGMGLYGLFLGCLLSKYIAAPLTGVLMSVYCLFVGAPVSACRALIMFLMLLGAKILGRSYDSLTALALAALLQLVYCPWSLWDGGFQLSYLAVLGVILLTPVFKQMIPVHPKIGQSLWVSLGASAATLPVLLYQYQSFAWKSILLNLLVIPPVALLLVLGIVLLILSLLPTAFFLPLHFVPVWGIKLITGYMELCIKWADAWPKLAGGTKKPSLVSIAVYYLILTIVVIFFIHKNTFLSGLLVLAGMQLLVLPLWWGVQITMLDVGQGEAVVIRSNTGGIYLSDGGSTSVTSVGTYRILPYLQAMGYRHIEGILLSHLDSDHINGIEELWENAAKEGITINRVFLPAGTKERQEDADVLERICSLAETTDTSVVFLRQNDSLTDGKLTITCLYPGADTGTAAVKATEVVATSVADRDEGSLVYSLNYGEFSMLFTGDLPQEKEKELLPVIDRLGSFTVLKVAHHGSATSSCQEFLDAVSPRVSLLTYGKNNRYGHPAEDVVERLRETGSLILSTAQSGAITLTPRQNGSCKIETFLP